MAHAAFVSAMTGIWDHP